MEFCLNFLTLMPFQTRMTLFFSIGKQTKYLFIKFKETVHPNYYYYYFGHHWHLLNSFQTFMTLFLLLNTKVDILKNVVNQTVSVLFDIHCMDRKYSGNQWEPK